MNLAAQVLDVIQLEVCRKFPWLKHKLPLIKQNKPGESILKIDKIVRQFDTIQFDCIYKKYFKLSLIHI